MKISTFISSLLSFCLFGCSGVSQLAPKDIAQLDEIAKTKAIVFIKMTPKNKERIAARIHLKRLGMAADGSVKERFFSFDEGKNSHADAKDGYFVLVLDPIPAEEAVIIQYINEHKTTDPSGDLIWTSYSGGCGGIEGLNNISLTKLTPGVYDFGVIDYEDHVSQIGEVSFRYHHAFDEFALKNFIKVKYPSLEATTLKRLSPVKFINRSNCPGPQTITIYM